MSKTWTKAGVRHKGGRWYYFRWSGAAPDEWDFVQLSWDAEGLDAYYRGDWREWASLVLQGAERSVKPIPEPPR